MSLLTENRVLVLNKNWTPINEISPMAAFAMMASDAATALNTDDNCFVPVGFDDWLKLSVREGDESVGTPRGRVRVPRVIIAVNYAKVVSKKPRLTMAKLRERDKDKCAYTGRKLKPEEMSMEHVLPRSKGGKKSWDNIVLADKKINSKRGNKPLDEVGLRLLQQPRVPEAVPAGALIKNRWGFPEWDIFLKTGKAPK